MAPETDDPYEALRARIKATQDAVDRLAEDTTRARESAGQDGSGGRPPPSSGPPGEEAQDEIRALVALVELLRDVLPPELRSQLAELIRQLLILVRAILDWWIERIGQPGRSDHPDPIFVEDIQVD